MKGLSKRLTLIQLNKQEVSEKELNRLLVVKTAVYVMDRENFQFI